MGTAGDLAHHIVNACIRDGHPVGNLQLQKILYLAQADSLRRGAPLFDDDFRAWRYGPCIPSVYREFSLCVGDPIRHICPEEGVTVEGAAVADAVAAECRDLMPWALVAKVCRPGGAWDVAYAGGGYGALITKRAIGSDMTLCDG